MTMNSNNIEGKKCIEKENNLKRTQKTELEDKWYHTLLKYATFTIYETPKEKQSKNKERDKTNLNSLNQGMIQNIKEEKTILSLLGDRVNLVIAGFLEVRGFLEQDIKKEINTGTKYSIMQLKNHLYLTNSKLNQLNDQYFKPNKLIIKKFQFSNEIVDWMFDSILKNEENIQDLIRKQFFEKYSQQKKEQIALFTKRLETAMNDNEFSNDVSDHFLKNLKKSCLKSQQSKFQFSLREHTTLSPSDLSNIADEIYNTEDKDSIFAYVTDMPNYLKSCYNKDFDTKLLKIETLQKSELIQNFENEVNTLLYDLNNIVSMFSNYYPGDDLDKETISSIFKFLVAYLQKDKVNENYYEN